MSDSEIPTGEPLLLSVDKSIRMENAADHSVITDSIESQPEQQPQSIRERTLTAKGQAYQECRHQEKEKEDHLMKKFNEVYEKWKRQVTQIKKVYEKLQQVRLPQQAILCMVDTCDAVLNIKLIDSPSERNGHATVRTKGQSSVKYPQGQEPANLQGKPPST